MNLVQVAERLVQPGKGILAADESTPTVGKRLSKHQVENTEDNRRAYRELFVTAGGIEASLSGVILYKETLFQRTGDGNAFLDVLHTKGIFPGIKVDEGLEPLAGAEAGESHTKGLTNLAENCAKYARQGAKFSKWRAAFTIGASTPSAGCIETNAEQLATYASISQANNLVPIVEPEILIDGTHSIDVSAEAASSVLTVVFAKLKEKQVDLRGCLLKIQMIMPGSEAPSASPQSIAENTLEVLTACVPRELAGVVFLSGGQSEEEATVNLNAINAHAIRTGQKHWGLTFSYGRSLQASVLEEWSKDRSCPERIAHAKKIAAALAAANSAATTGSYQGPHPSNTTGGLKESFRGWTN